MSLANTRYEQARGDVYESAITPRLVLDSFHERGDADRASEEMEMHRRIPNFPGRRCSFMGARVYVCGCANTRAHPILRADASDTIEKWEFPRDNVEYSAL